MVVVLGLLIGLSLSLAVLLAVSAGLESTGRNDIRIGSIVAAILSALPAAGVAMVFGTYAGGVVSEFFDGGLLLISLVGAIALTFFLFVAVCACLGGLIGLGLGRIGRSGTGT